MQTKEDSKGERVHGIKLNLIDEPEHSARKTIDDQALKDLENSIKVAGVINPIIVIQHGLRFEIVAGHRRFLAARNIRLETIPAIVRKQDKQGMEITRFHENLFRADLTAWEEAHLLSDMKSLLQMTNAELAQIAGRSESYISQRLAIIDYPPCLTEALKRKQITFSVARELAFIRDLEQLEYYLGYAIRDGATPALATQWRLNWQGSQPTRLESTPPAAPIAQKILTQAPQTNCVLCGKPAPYAELITMWVHPTCQHDLIHAIDEAQETEKSGQGGS